MATTTPNFGWSVPTSSDLVKNGAVAIETLGDSIDASLVDLKGGTTGQVLAKATNTDMDFTWTTAGGGGKILQVVTAQSTTSTTIATTTYTDTTLTATITPTLNTSKILVLVSQAVQYTIPATLISIGARIVRGSTTIFDAGLSADRLKATGTSAVEHALRMDLKYIDSPATTSATTYKTQGCLAATGSGESSIWQPVSPFGGTAAPSTIILMEIGA
jgi:hypothetical protein